jgi:hypothetical protein
MTTTSERLYNLLPAIHRIRDAEQGYPLRELLHVIGEQVALLEADIGQLYENWFVETCQDWVVPYLGDLIGYRQVHEAGEPGALVTPQDRLRNKILIARRDVANTLRSRRRRGTLAVLEQLAADVSNWPSRVVEFAPLLSNYQGLNHFNLQKGHTANLHQLDALDRLDGPFDELAHTIDVRSIKTRRNQGRSNLPTIGLFVWRLIAFAVTETTAFRIDQSTNRFTFSVLGNDMALLTMPRSEAGPHTIAGEQNLPIPIRRRAFEQNKAFYYGPGKSVALYRRPGELVPLEQIQIADLSNWQYRPNRGYVALDPELGRIAFPLREPPRQLLVSYWHAFSMAIGGGEYARPRKPSLRSVNGQTYGYYPVAEQVSSERAAQALQSAIDQWQKEAPARALIEIFSNNDYTKQLAINLGPGQALELRAADGYRPLICLLNTNRGEQDDFTINAAVGSRLILDGLLISGRGLRIIGDPHRVQIRHCTLVPGWELEPNCKPRHEEQPSITLIDSPPPDEGDPLPVLVAHPSTTLSVEHSIIGSIRVLRDEVGKEPVTINLSDSILDATSPTIDALAAADCGFAHAIATFVRCTVIGEIYTHAITLAENSLFIGKLRVARSQIGCMRFCFVSQGSRTPRRFNCQPDLVEVAVAEADLKRREQRRVEPQFNSLRYGRATYCQLAHGCAPEIVRGADDESEMGVFHDLFQPQRAANLRTRLGEYTAAGMETGIIYAS